jgi:hypothetical protein
MNIDTAQHPDFNDVVTENEKHIRLYRIARDNAERNIGKAIFDFQPKVIQRALVAEEILAIINAQDDDISDARIREMTNALWQINGTV